MEPYKVLIVDDEPDIVEIIAYNLQHAGYQTACAADGEEALEKARGFMPDLVMLDVMMPRRNGMDTLQALRRDPALRETPVLFLTALGDEQSEIRGLNAGADDYVAKPIKPTLLLSRVKALLRRYHKEDGSVIQIGDLRIDREKFVVDYRGRSPMLAKKEFELLELLASKPGRVFLRQEILSRVWGAEVIVGDRTIDVHVRKIRQKLGDGLISTVKGVGYKLQAD